MKKQLRQRIEKALNTCYERGLLNSGEIPDFTLEVPARAEHGDYATNLALMLAKPERRSPRQIAEVLVEVLSAETGAWERLEIAGPGFINFFLSNRSWCGVLDEIVRQGDGYGETAYGAGRRIQVEFVSANPTGPLHIGHGRGAALGDATASLLGTAGYEVQREYYINDAGNQMQTLGQSLMLRYRQLLGEDVDFPGDCYQGDYIREMASGVVEREGNRFLDMPEDEALAWFSRFGSRKILSGIEEDLAAFGVRFDNWYSEQGLYDRGEVSRSIELLKERGLTYEKEGALWLRTSDYGDDKDRVLVRSNGATTYFASDIAYHKEKFDLGYETVIDVWGADHHGYVPRMKAVLDGLGKKRDSLNILLVQLVNLLREGEQVAMSTRAGEFVTLRDVVEEVGRDACRFFFLMRRSDSQFDFDLDLAKKQSTENPVYYVQYAHARVCSVNRNAAEQKIALPRQGEADLARLALDEEMALIKSLSRYPEVIIGAAESLEPHRVTFYLQEVAAQFHSYYNRHRIITEDIETTRARLYLANCVRQVLANALKMLGVSAPEKM